MITIYGKDIERLIGIIGTINNEAAKQIELLSYDSDYRIKTINHTHNIHIGDSTESAGGDFSHTHEIDLNVTGGNATGATGRTGYVSNQLTYPDEYLKDDQGENISPYIIYEDESPKTSDSYVNLLIELGGKLQNDISNIQRIEGKLYVKANKVHNSYGSPFTEIYDLKKKIDLCKNYSDQHSHLQWLGEKHVLLNFLQMVLTTSVDAKFAVIMYHDYLQRGYDANVNGKKSSITWDDFNDGKSDGNIK